MNFDTCGDWVLLTTHQEGIYYHYIHRILCIMQLHRHDIVYADRYTADCHKKIMHTTIVRLNGNMSIAAGRSRVIMGILGHAYCSDVIWEEYGEKRSQAEGVKS